MNSPSRSGRNWILASAGVGAITRALAYLPWTTDVVFRTTGRFDAIAYWLPPETWSWIWLSVGLLLVVSIFWKRITRVAMSLLTGLLTLWGTSSIVSWALDYSHRSWVTGSFFVVAAVWAAVLTVLLERRGGES